MGTGGNIPPWEQEEYTTMGAGETVTHREQEERLLHTQGAGRVVHTMGAGGE